MVDLAQKYQDDFEAAVGTARYEGIAEGALKKVTAVILNMHHRGESVDKIADIVMESKEDVEKVIQAGKNEFTQ
ncbi:hypothetical protein CL176_00755 [Suicoccus acidiformans]|uniref:Transposase n=1 Tax=Suicoccus acidiformans TaxID=2036206 RepID=A0A347WHW6_9LACT|nr:hypothetical protein [Suicoccus acidiformans]AXY24673.1 hypothetical protein CL176_00755 [Suicoccus acidiformans]